MLLHDLRTPSVLMEFARVRANVERMQGLAKRAGVRLRPHAKTHKIPQVAAWQLEAGAVGICCAKLAEAETFAHAGLRDIRLPYPLHPSNADRVFALLDRGVRLSFAVDLTEVALAWSDVARAAGRTLDVLVKVDVGFHRCGVDPERPDVPAFIAQVGAAPGLRLRGLLSHAGHAYLAQSDGALATIAREEAQVLQRVAHASRLHGAEIDELSVGATPTARFVADTPGLTEIRPGNYVYYDRSQVALGSARVEDCALTVLSTVVSKHKDRIILDAGSKTLSSDPIARAGHAGFGALFGDVAAADTLDDTFLIERLSEEHATVRVRGASKLQPGDRVRILPNHACAVSNLTDEVVLVSGTHVIDRIPVVARGKST